MMTISISSTVKAWHFHDGATSTIFLAQTNGGLLLTLLVDFTGFNSAPGTWKIIMDASNGNGPILFDYLDS